MAPHARRPHAYVGPVDHIPIRSAIKPMATLHRRIELACKLLHLRVETEFILELTNSPPIQTVAKIEHLGAPNGMLVLSNFESIQGHVDLIEAAGYGFSVLDEPEPSDAFDLELYRDVFRDWGWSGPPELIPDWL